MSRRSVLVVLLILMSMPVAAARRRAVVAPSSYPPCSMVTGVPAVTFTRDEGRSIAPFAERLQPLAYIYGLTLLGDGTLAAWKDDDLLVSSDGCTWRVAATVPGADFPPKLTPARDGSSRVFAWSENRNFLVRYDARGASKLKPPVEITGVGTNPLRGDDVRLGGGDGSLWESNDAGETWTRIAKLDALAYRFAFDGNDWNRIAIGTMSQGAFRSNDGGRTWTRMQGFGASGANVFEIVFTHDGSAMWAMGIDLAESAANAPSHGRHIYRATGAVFVPVVDEAPGVKLINGPTMAAHPSDADVVYFVFGTHIFDYGTDFFRYDHATRALTNTHLDGVDDIDAIAFAPGPHHVMYLGLEVVD